MVDLCTKQKLKTMKTILTSILILATFQFNAYNQELASIAKVKNESASPMPDNASKIAVYSFEVYNVLPEEMKKITPEMASTHFLGEEIAKKVYLLEEDYTYEVAIAPGNPATKTMFRKPILYNAVRKIEKSLRKSVKAGEMTKEQAAGTFNKVLDVAINIKSIKTDSFEETVKSMDRTPDLIALFTSVSLNYTN
jgi:hypothetical protein